jgi:5-methylcytosine-specific restriction protein A
MGRVEVATIADHIEPHRGDMDKFWNGPLQSLCGICHSAVKQREESGGHLGCGLDGVPLKRNAYW